MKDLRTGAPNPEEEVLDEEEKVVNEEAILRGGKIETMYNNFWSILNAAKEACAEPSQLAFKLANSAEIKRFLRMTDSMSIIPSFSSTSNMQAAFRTLSPQIQNLLMAVGEINMKISQHEEGLSETLSAEYSKAARAGAQCITHICKQIENIQGRRNDRVNTLYRAAIGELLGQKYAAWTIASTRSLQRWSETAAVVTSMSLDHPWIAAFEAIRQGTDIGTPEAIMSSLSVSRRQLEYVLDGLGALVGSEKVTVDTRELDEKIGLRLQKHEIAKQRYQEMSNRNPIELAESLRYLHLADSEIQTSLQSVESKTAVVKTGVDMTHFDEVRELCKEQYPILVQLIDSGHILQAEASRLKASMNTQVVSELRLDVLSAISAATLCLDTCKSELKKVYETSIEKQTNIVRELRGAEKTLASEISHYSKGDGTSLEVCAKAMAQVSRDRRIVRDIHIVNKHKKLLHGLVEIVRTSLLSLK